MKNWKLTAAYIILVAIMTFVMQVGGMRFDDWSFWIVLAISAVLASISKYEGYVEAINTYKGRLD